MLRCKRKYFVGFTLVELLVVMSIVIVLLAMLMPTVVSIMESRYAHKSSYYVSALARGAESYWVDNRNFYPGQANTEPLENNTYTGSQILAACVFGYSLDDINRENPEPKSEYMTYKPGMLFNPDDYYNNVPSGMNRPNTLSDGFPDPMPILYFPSRKGISGLLQYKLGDNDVYRQKPSEQWVQIWDQSTFKSLIRDADADGDESVDDNDKPHKDGKFLLIAPGIDRQYGGDNDITNGW